MITLNTIGGRVQIDGHKVSSSLGLVEGRIAYDGNPDNMPIAFSAALDGLESFLLALAANGVVTEDNRYAVENALDTAYNAICEHFPDE